MRRRIHIMAVAVLFCSIGLGAQNNPYKIDDACYEIMCKADVAKDRFIQNMTHELRTPLNAITGFSQLLALPDGMFSYEEKEEFGKHVLNNTSMMTMLLDDLMSTSAMDSGGYRITVGEAECESICKEAMNAAEHRLQPGARFVFAVTL